MIISAILYEVSEVITDLEQTPNLFGRDQDPDQSIHAYTFPQNTLGGMVQIFAPASKQRPT